MERPSFIEPQCEKLTPTGSSTVEMYSTSFGDMKNPTVDCLTVETPRAGWELDHGGDGTSPGEDGNVICLERIAAIGVDIAAGFSTKAGNLVVLASMRTRRALTKGSTVDLFSVQAGRLTFQQLMMYVSRSCPNGRVNQTSSSTDDRTATIDSSLSFYVFVPCGC